jgi:cathepsin F
MNQPFYYQKTATELPTNFEPIVKRKKNDTPFSYNFLRNMTIATGSIGLVLLLYSTTLTSSVHETTSLDSTIINTNTNTRIKYSTLDNDTITQMFDEFKTTYNKSYASIEEENLRYNYFNRFLEVIDERNNNDTYAVHGITKFADLSSDEFKKVSLGYKPIANANANANAKIAQINNYEGTETYVNWANVYTTGVKDQGYCGSCWAFSATEQIESDAIRLGLLNITDTLSPEQIVQCDSVDDGCDGGNTETAFEYVRTAGGIERNEEYPYTSYYDVTGICESESSEFIVTVDEYYLLTDEDAMMSHIFSTGPISICLDASTWSSYVSGIITTCGKEVDHCVQAVGLNKEEGYWIVRNSWGIEWGNEGYIWLESGSNMCNIAYDPKYVSVTNATSI